MTNDTGKTDPATDHAVVLGELGILAYAASMMTHEALGHGIYCWAGGGRTVALTLWAEGCTLHPAGIEAAGPGVQCAAGVLAWFVLRRLPVDLARLRCFFWLYMVFDLFISSGYVAYSGITDFGDAALLVAKLRPPVLWRGVLCLLGGAVYYLSMRVTSTELGRFAGSDHRPRRLARLVWIPYVAAGAFACAAAALNKATPSGAVMGLAVASSFGAGLGMPWLPGMQRGLAMRDACGTRYLRWNGPWVLAAAVVIACILIFIGPGLAMPAA